MNFEKRMMLTGSGTYLVSAVLSSLLVDPVPALLLAALASFHALSGMALNHLSFCRVLDPVVTIVCRAGRSLTCLLVAALACDLCSLEGQELALGAFVAVPVSLIFEFLLTKPKLETVT